MSDRKTINLTAHVNRFRAQGYKYEQVKEKLVKMGNLPEDADRAIAEYVKEMCGTEQSKAE